MKFWAQTSGNRQWGSVPTFHQGETDINPPSAPISSQRILGYLSIVPDSIVMNTFNTSLVDICL